MSPGTRVLHLVGNMRHGGVQRWLLAMLAEFDRAALAMDVCCCTGERGALAGDAEMLGARVLTCRLRPAPGGFRRCLTGVLGSGGYDLVHNHQGSHSGVATWAARQAGVPVVTTVHNTEHPALGWVRRPGLAQARRVYFAVGLRYTLRHSAVVSGVSQAVLDALPGGRRDARVLTLGVPLPAPGTPAGKLAVRRELGCPAETPLLIHVGRFVATKNHETVLEVFARVVAARPAARLLLVGDGPRRQATEREAQRRGLDGTVLFAGRRDDAARLIGAADVLLLPSRHEGFPVVALEAGAAGVPVVGSNIPSLAEAVADGETGSLHPVADVAGMAAAVTGLLDDPERREAMGGAARARVAARYSQAKAAESLADLYQHALAVASA